MFWVAHAEAVATYVYHAVIITPIGWLRNQRTPGPLGILFVEPKGAVFLPQFPQLECMLPAALATIPAHPQEVLFPYDLLRGHDHLYYHPMPLGRVQPYLSAGVAAQRQPSHIAAARA